MPSRLLVACAVLGLLAACGRTQSAEQEQPQASAQPGKKQRAQLTGVGACDLVTAEDATALLGGEVTAGEPGESGEPPSESDEKQCVYASAVSGTTLTVQFAPPKQKPRRLCKLGKDGGEPVDGIGDNAWYNPDTGFFVQFSSETVRNACLGLAVDPPDRLGIDELRSLAQAVLARPPLV